MRGSWLFALLLVGCGAPAPEESDPTAPTAARPRPRPERDAGREPPKPRPEPVVDAGASDAPEEPPCAYVSYEVELTWPGVHVALESAAARWYRWYESGGVECELRVLSTAARNIGSAGARGDIVLNTDSPLILDSDSCSGEHALLIDVLTHELGHVYGLSHGDSGAMGPHGHCEPIAPTRREIRDANGCGDWGPPPSTECPP